MMDVVEETDIGYANISADNLHASTLPKTKCNNESFAQIQGFLELHRE